MQSTWISVRLHLHWKDQNTNLSSSPDSYTDCTIQKTAVLIFRSGKVNCTGAKNLANVRLTIKTIIEKLKKSGIEVEDDPEIVVQNIVAVYDLESDLNLTQIAMSLGLENVEYEPEQFPGLVYRVEEPKVVLLLFGSGKVVCTGAKEENEIEQAVIKVKKELQKVGLI